MDEKIASLTTQLTAILSQVFTIVGHTPEEIQKHSKAFTDTVLAMTFQRTLPSLSAENKAELDKLSKEADPANPVASAEQIKHVFSLFPADEFEKHFKDVTQHLFTQYLLTVGKDLTPEQRSKIQTLLSLPE
jgi:hypothetical protein